MYFIVMVIPQININSITTINVVFLHILVFYGQFSECSQRDAETRESANYFARYAMTIFRTVLT